MLRLGWLKHPHRAYWTGCLARSRKLRAYESRARLQRAVGALHEPAEPPQLPAAPLPKPAAPALPLQEERKKCEAGCPKWAKVDFKCETDGGAQSVSCSCAGDGSAASSSSSSFSSSSGGAGSTNTWTFAS